MKKVYNNSSEVIHLFANKEQNEARCSNVFFDNNKNIYSYGHHYILATFLNNDTILINDTGYSVTTSKHISQIRNATRHLKQFLKSETNIDLVYSTIILNRNKLINARKSELYILPSLYIWKKLNEFIIFTKNKEIKKSDKYKELKRIIKKFNNFSKDSLKEFQIKESKRIKAKNNKELKKNLHNFNTYKINRFNNANFDFLRLSKDNNFIETSQQVRVNINEAKILFSMIKSGKNIKGFKIDYYTVISMNGTLKIGCHNIPKKEVYRFANLMKW